MDARALPNQTNSERCFFTLKRMKVKDIHAELESLNGPEAFPLLTVKKWWKRWQQGRTGLFTIPGPEGFW
jgi:hypothetical protein